MKTERKWVRQMIAISISGCITLVLGIILFESIFDSLLLKVSSVIILGAILILIESKIAIVIKPKTKKMEDKNYPNVKS